MANTTYGPYAPTTWVFNTTTGTFTRLNNLETQSSVALHGLNPDIWSPYVLEGMVCTKDGSISNQLDVTSGRAYIEMTDGTLGLIITIASVASEFLTSAASSTYHLYLQPDGTWYWNTSNSPETNSLYICSVATDGSGNISTVTDQRTLTAVMLSSLIGQLTLPPLTGITFAGTSPYVLETPQSGSANGVVFKTWSGSAGVVPFSVGGQFDSALSWVDTSGNLRMGGSGIVSVSGTLLLESLQSGGAKGIEFATWTGSAQAVPFSVGGQFGSALSYIDSSGDLFLGGYANVGTAGNSGLVQSTQSGSSSGLYFKTWNGSSGVTPFSIGAQYNSALAWVDNSGNYNGGVSCGIPMTRLISSTWTAETLPIYSGASAPTATQAPPTGSVYIGA